MATCSQMGHQRQQRLCLQTARLAAGTRSHHNLGGAFRITLLNISAYITFEACAVWSVSKGRCFYSSGSADSARKSPRTTSDKEIMNLPPAPFQKCPSCNPPQQCYCKSPEQQHAHEGAGHHDPRCSSPCSSLHPGTQDWRHSLCPRHLRAPSPKDGHESLRRPWEGSWQKKWALGDFQSDH